MSTHKPPQEAPQPPAQPRAPTLSGAAQRERLSALADGERGASGLSQADELSAALADWRDDAETRRVWHSYQLIGDALRSEDLARPASQDLAFLSRLRERLEAEPLVLAPAVQAPAVRPLARGHKFAVALAASCAVVTVALLLARDAGTGAGAGQAPALAAAGSALPDPSRGGAGGPATTTLTQGVLRDPRLDEFLRLHQMARGGLAVGAPGGTLQRADLQMPGGVER